jgi:hypothetical protein
MHMVRSYLAAGVAFGQVFGGTQYNRAAKPVMMPVMHTSAVNMFLCYFLKLSRSLSAACDRISKEWGQSHIVQTCLPRHAASEG